ncbi:hypothetical protein COM83_30665, partial [Bacillus cereus]
YKHFKKMRGAMGNLKIEENVTLSPYYEKLDLTFKWHRNDELFGNAVEFNGDEYTFGTIIPIKGSWEL